MQLLQYTVMGWLPAWGSTSKPEGPSSSDTINSEEYRPPGRQTRAKCWDSRDVFNECLNRNNILDAIKDKDAADKVCGKESDLFEKNCASSWVSFCILPFFIPTRIRSRHFFHQEFQATRRQLNQAGINIGMILAICYCQTATDSSLRI